MVKPPLPAHVPGVKDWSSLVFANVNRLALATCRKELASLLMLSAWMQPCNTDLRLPDIHACGVSCLMQLSCACAWDSQPHR